MAERKPLSKRTRFEVFKRDLFCCQYCGQTVPTVTLEVDHIIPVSKGGTNQIDNLIAACFDCNRGKSDVLLDTLPDNTTSKILLLREKQEQYKEYQKLLSKIEKHIQIDIQKVEDAFQHTFPEKILTEHFKNGSVKIFIRKLGVEDVVDSMYIACSKKSYSSYDTTKYFCGICWNKIRKKFPDYPQKKEVDHG